MLMDFDYVFIGDLSVCKNCSFIRVGRLRSDVISLIIVPMKVSSCPVALAVFGTMVPVCKQARFTLESREEKLISRRHKEKQTRQVFN